MTPNHTHSGKFPHAKILHAGIVAISALCLHPAYATPCLIGGLAADPFQHASRATPFAPGSPVDLADDSPQAKTAQGIAAPPLDLFGSGSDLKNAATAMGNTPPDAASLSNGVLTVRLTQNGLNIVNIRIPDGTAISSIDIVTSGGAIPAGLVLNIAGSNIAFTGYKFNLGPLDNRQVLLSFGGETVLLSTLSLKIAALARLAVSHFDKGGVNGALILAWRPGLSDAAFGAPLHGYGVSGGGMTAASRGG